MTSFWSRCLTPFQHVSILALFSIFVLSEIVYQGRHLFGYPAEGIGWLLVFSMPVMGFLSIASLLVRPEYLSWCAKKKGWIFIGWNVILVFLTSLTITFIILAIKK